MSIFGEMSLEEFNDFMKKNEQKQFAPRPNTVGVGVNGADEVRAAPVNPTSTRKNRKRTINKRLLTDPLKQLLKKYQSQDELRPIIVGVDKLRLRLNACIKDAAPGEQSRIMGNNVVLQLKSEYGTQLHRCLWEVYLHGELVGTLETGGRSANMAYYDYLTLRNEVIWQRGWSRDTLPDILEGLKAEVNSVANLDICIDGNNDVVDVLNMYYVQNMVQQGTGARLVRCKKGLPQMGTNNFDDKIGAFAHYYIGAKGGDKRFIVYEKNQEISEISPHKQYIRDTWDINGIDSSGEVWRSEIRLKGKMLDSFDIKDLTQLETATYLLEIFKTACEGFVEFRVSDGKVNINNAEPIDLLYFTRLGIKRLERVKRNLQVGLYKAKMSLHSAFQHIISGDFANDETQAALKHVYNLVNRFNLREYVIKTLPKWLDKYRRDPTADFKYLQAYI